jgi:hypothetical protein
VTCRRVFRMGQLRPDMAWAKDYARMMEATTIGFMIGAVFLNRGHFDLVYHWLALVTGLSTVAMTAWFRGPVQQMQPAGRARVAVRRRPVLAASGWASSKPQPRWGRAH